MDVPTTLRSARRSAGLSQESLAARAGTSQATVSAYENGRKRPTVDTLSRLLAASGARLSTRPMRAAVVEPSFARHERVGRTLVDVLALAAALPVRHEAELKFPRVPTQ